MNTTRHGQGMVPTSDDGVLEVYRDGRYYDLINDDITSDIGFYMSRIKSRGGRALELACGTGRITIPLSLGGVDITGLDISRPMLETARMKALLSGASPSWVHGDCRSFHLGSSFDTIILPFNSACHLMTDEDVDSTIRSIAGHCVRGTEVIVDVFNPVLEVLGRDQGRLHFLAEFEDPDGGGRMLIMERDEYDIDAGINTVTWFWQLGRRTWTTRMILRIFRPGDLDTFLGQHGLEVTETLGYFDGTPFQTDSPKQIIIARCSG